MNIDTSSNTRPREAVLLVAGVGSRLEPMTHERPNCLVEVGGMPLLQRLRFQLQHVGIERVVLATGHLHDTLMAEVERWDLELEIEAQYNDSYDTENNAVSLREAMRGLDGRRFLLCDGDILLRRVQMLEQIAKAPQENVLAMMRFDGLGDEEMKLTVDGDGQVQDLGKTIDSEVADGESLGIQKIGESGFLPLAERLDSLSPDEREQMYYEDVFSELIDRGIEFFACDLPPGGWTEIDTPAELEGAREMAARWGHDTVIA